MNYAEILKQRRALDTREAVELRSPQLLAALLREAKSEHTKFEAELGHPDEDWAAWYAAWMLGRVETSTDLTTVPPTKEQLDAD